MQLPPLTHKGWFGFCPVYVGGLETEAPLVMERHWSLIPVLAFCEFLFGVAMMITAAVNPQAELNWPILITGELPEGRTHA